MKKILVMAVHPDDETLGCGGALLKHKAGGDRLYWLIATDELKALGPRSPVIRRREGEIARAAKAYGFADVFRLNLPARGVDTVPVGELVGKIAAVVNRVKPDTVYLPFHGDVHSDHRYFFQAAYSCLKAFRAPSIKTVLMMETVSETEFAPSMKEDAFIPNYFVDISAYLGKKLRIMAIYRGEMRPHPFPRSVKNIRSLAAFRGAAAGCASAEAFMLLKGIR